MEGQGARASDSSYMFSKHLLSIFFASNLTRHWDYVRDQDVHGPCPHRNNSLLKATDEEIKQGPLWQLRTPRELWKHRRARALIR